MRRASAPVGVALGLAIGACFVKPDPPNADDDARTADAASIDGLPADAPIDSLLPSCIVMDNFASGGSGCGIAAGVGSGSGSQTIHRMNGMLSMFAPGGAEAYSQCQSPAALWRTVVVQIPQKLTALNSSTIVGLSFNTSEKITLTLAPSGAVSIDVTNSDDTAFVTDQTYFRFRKSGSNVLVDWSSDKNGWTIAKTYALSAEPSAVSVLLRAEFGSSAGSASFDNLDACSP